MAIKLSDRLERIIAQVTPGNRILDVGCDHAHVPIRLLQDGTIPSAMAFDVIDGPIKIARENLALFGYEDKCEVRKSDGLEKYEIGEADTLIIAGMGGIVMTGILENDAEKSESFRELILEPQSEYWLVRDFLLSHQIGIVTEEIIQDGYKFYPIIRAVPGETTRRPDWDGIAAAISQMSDQALKSARVDRDSIIKVLNDEQFRYGAETIYGPCLLADFDKTLHQYVIKELKGRIRVYEELAANAGSSEGASQRIEQVQSEIGMLQVLMFLFLIHDQGVI